MVGSKRSSSYREYVPCKGVTTGGKPCTSYVRAWEDVCHKHLDTFANEKPLIDPRVRRFNSVVYFIRAPALRCVKIGTTTNLPGRLVDLSQACPARLKVIGSFGGAVQVERWCHFHCVAERSHYEWFHWNERTKSFIEMVLSHGDEAATMLCPNEFNSDRRIAQGRLAIRQAGVLPSRQSIRLSGGKARATDRYIKENASDVTPLGFCTCTRCTPSTSTEVADAQ